MSGKPTILVVDDDAPILLLMRNLLREFGFETMIASTGADAIAAARRQRPALVLLDRNMPGMSGDEVVTALREEEGLARLPILMLTGEPMSRSEIASLHADGAILKPFDVMELVSLIRSHVGESRTPAGHQQSLESNSNPAGRAGG